MNNKDKIFSQHQQILTITIVLPVIICLYLTSHYHYLLFHSIAEIFSIIIACAVFMLAWNSKEHTENYYLVYLGIAYLFIGILDLLHTLSYKGMNIFRDYDYYANQLWIGARYMESLTLLAFVMFVGSRKKIPYTGVILFYTVITALILASVFYWKIFPVCFIDGKGLTLFKKISEYIICFILIAALIMAQKKRHEFDSYIYKLLIWSICLTIGGELAFTFYISNYGFSNLIGHYLKIGSFYLIYKAIIETGLKNPFNLIFKKLKESEERYKNLFDMALVGIFRTTPDGSRILVANPAAARIFGYDAVDMFVAESVPEKFYVNPGDRQKFHHNLENEGKADGFECLVRDRNNTLKHLLMNAVLYREAGYIEKAITDITEQVENRKKIQEAAERDAIQRGKIEMAGSVLHDIGNAITNVGTITARLSGEAEWTEISELEKLERMAEQKRDAFAAALGQGKEEAFIAFIRELKNSLKERSEYLHADSQTMAKTVSHINNILELQRRYTRDGLTEQRRLLNIGELIEDALSMHTSGFEKRNIMIQHHISPGLPHISGDRTKLIQVFLNLFKNSCEAFDVSERQDDRKLDITIELLNQDKICIIITDNATGFEPDQAEHFFEQGFSTKDRDSGMGLHQCRAIIKAHAGNMRLESSGKGQGARAFIELPAT